MKRFIDALSSASLLIILAPVFAIIGICIKLNSKGPVFFTQMRIGRNNELFKFYKFRSMKIGTPNVSTNKLGNSKSYQTNVVKYGKTLTLRGT
ncbi:sugar transferase [Clostridium sp.]|uniref:sugar transferase n=1 Tax=Clostridium sp. TaxID=1506 RepID=UPI0026032581|nr:sugar transferase [Clostridium sp.]